MPMRPLALFVSIAILAGCSACATGGKAPAPTNPFHTKGVRALAGGDRLAVQGCSQKAMESYFKAVEHFTLADDQDALAACFNNIGNVYLENGQAGEALVFYEQALWIYESREDTRSEVRVLTNMAAAHLMSRSSVLAESRLDQADSSALEVGFSWPQTQVVRANLMRETGNAQGALAALQALAQKEQSPGPAFDASLNVALGKSHLYLGRFDEAFSAFSNALKVDQERGALLRMAGDLREMGRCLALMEQPKDAAWHLQRALGIALLLGDETEQEVTETMLTDLPGEIGSTPVPDYFLERWAQGDSSTSPCD
ncbi:tetratricopeptide repeat protein [Desulfoluna spongiiphila]|uniref:tetratricopeptide repeat protein n=1 Tax=Desulfoluna spongiiphila TaxID=419481 RepID=UPI00125A8EFA|nr:tetratricopeptide repeat protein [Desulfoluna spongiiphila]VVS92589.1 prokaryotic membrane lipoprotein lipid attachment site profile [Desulfoluna spongiiphila]